jgi:hypothetical protein
MLAAPATRRVDPFLGAAVMGVNTNLRNVVLAIDSLRGAQAACANLKPMAMPMTDRELHQRAEVIDKVIRARRKLQQLRDRAETLQGALDRFKARREAMRA